MPGRRTDGADMRRFLTVLAATGLVAGAVGRTWGPDIAAALDQTATTETGWLLIGWLISGPPILITALVWHDRRLLRRRQRRNLSIWLAVWIGLSMLLLPGLIHGHARYFGRHSSAIDPLSTGWGWGAVGNLVGLLFAAVVLVVLHTSVRGRPSPEQVGLTARFVEIGWLLALAVTLGFALYSGSTTFFNP